MSWFSILKSDTNFWAVEDVQKIRKLIKSYFASIPWEKKESIFTNMEHLIGNILVYADDTTIKIKLKRGDDSLASVEQHKDDLQQSLLNDTGTNWNIITEAGE